MNQPLVTGNSLGAQENGSVNWNRNADTKEDTSRNRTVQISLSHNRATSSFETPVTAEESSGTPPNSNTKLVTSSSAEPCPLFLCSGALPKDFSTSSALKISGALIDASQAPSESEDGNTDIDDHAPLSCYYESSCSESDAANRARKAEAIATARQKRPRIVRLKRGRHHPFRKRSRADETSGSAGASNVQTSNTTPVIAQRLSRSHGRRDTHTNSIGEVQAFMTLWGGIGNPSN